MLVLRGGEVEGVVNASTAGIPGYHSPEGRFRVFRRVEGIDTSPLGRLWNPLYLYRGYAMHGSTSVPPEPASHGCVRVPALGASGPTGASNSIVRFGSTVLSRIVVSLSLPNAS